MARSLDEIVTLKLSFNIYWHIEEAKKDILEALEQWKTFTPKTEKYWNPTNGRDKVLVCLDGTIPVEHSGAIHDLPIVIYLNEFHPHLEPFCYVKQIKGMIIKRSKFIEEDGRIRLIYLERWDRDYSRLAELIGVMQTTFTNEWPVYKEAEPYATKSGGDNPASASSEPVPGPSGCSYNRPGPSRHWGERPNRDPRKGTLCIELDSDTDSDD